MRHAVALAAAVVAVAGCGGGGDDGAAVRGAVQRYYAALGGGDAAAACAALTQDSREALAAYGHEVLRQGHGSCQATMALVQRRSAAHLRGLRHPHVLAVQVDGARAQVRVEGVNEPTRLERDGGRWAIVAKPSGETD